MADSERSPADREPPFSLPSINGRRSHMELAISAMALLERRLNNFAQALTISGGPLASIPTHM